MNYNIYFCNVAAIEVVQVVDSKSISIKEMHTIIDWEVPRALLKWFQRTDGNSWDSSGDLNNLERKGYIDVLIPGLNKSEVNTII